MKNNIEIVSRVTLDEIKYQLKTNYTDKEIIKFLFSCIDDDIDEPYSVIDYLRKKVNELEKTWEYKKVDNNKTV